jgi:SAM-dependent methyltransferase
MSPASILVPLSRPPDAVDRAWLARLASAPDVAEVVVASAHAFPATPAGSRVRALHVDGGRGQLLRAAIEASQGEQLVVQDPHPGYSPDDYPRVLAPLRNDKAEAVYGNRYGVERGSRLDIQGLANGGLRLFSNAVTNLALSDPDCGVKAFDGKVLRSLSLQNQGDGVDAEITFKIAAQFYRVFEVELLYSDPPQHDSIARKLLEARTLFKYASANDADELHEGYNTLLRMDGAPRYNAWLGRKLRPFLGRRVLEVGAGIGTITRQIESGRELVVALEIDPFYVKKLQNLFRDQPNVLPYLSPVEGADWDYLKSLRLDSVILSNVLEHIADDGRALADFKRLLPPGGRVVILVPALPALYGSIDEAVGHHRRYTSAGLRNLLESQGLAVERLEPMNLIGIPGWFLNGRVFKRRTVPAVQLKIYDQLAPLFARMEDRFQVPVGMSLLAIGRT